MAYGNDKVKELVILAASILIVIIFMAAMLPALAIGDLWLKYSELKQKVEDCRGI